MTLPQACRRCGTPAEEPEITLEADGARGVVCLGCKEKLGGADAALDWLRKALQEGE